MPAVKVSQPTGAVHDGDTFAMRNGGNARLYGVDAFELDQTGRQGGEAVPIGRDSRDYLAGLITPNAVMTDTGTRTYGRPVVSVQAAGIDTGHSMIATGNAIPTPRYLANDPARKGDYIAAQRDAIAAERGAYAGEYQNPEEYRRQGQAAPKRGKIAMTSQQAGEYDALIRNPKTKPEELETWAKAQGQSITNASNILSFVRRNPNAKASTYFQQSDVTGEAVLPDRHNIVERNLGALNDGIAEFVGGPVDLVNLGLSAVGLPMSDKPVLGSTWIKDLMHAGGVGQYDEDFAPRSDAERYTQAFARGMGQSIVPIGGTMAAGTRIAASALPSVLEGGAVRQALRNSTAEAAARPGVLIASEAGAGVGSQVAGQAGDDIAPGNPYVQAAAQIVGGLAGGLGGGMAAGRRAAVRARPGEPSSIMPEATPPVVDEIADVQSGASASPSTTKAAAAGWDEFPDAPVAQPAVAAMKNESLEPSPSISSREPDVIDVAGRPTPVSQAPSEAQLRAASERIEPADVLPLSSPAAGDVAPDAHLAGNIRLDKLDTPQSIKRALTVTDQRVGGFDAARRGKITQQEMEQLAAELGMTADGLLARRSGQALNAEEALAARQILAKSGNEMVNLARRVQALDNPGDELLAEFRQAWVRHVAIQEQVAGATAEAGRALAQFRMVANSRQARGRVLPGLIDAAGGTGRLKEAADLILNHADDPTALNAVAARAMKPRFRDKLIELWYNSLLSGPQTHAVNILSNTMTALAQLPEHALAAGIGAARQVVPSQRVADRILFSELGARTTGMLQGAREGLREAGRVFRGKDSSDLMSKLETDSQHAISGVKGSILRTPTRALAAEDELFKAMARRTELAGLAVRRASKEGLRGQAARDRASELLANPTDEMLARSIDYGRYLTFQKDLGDVGQGVQRITQAAPLLKLVLPFVKTPTNLLKFTLERSPGAPLLREWRSDMAAGGARRDLAMAKAIAGSSMMALVTQLAAEGHLTGGGPADDRAKAILRADGWQPYSVRVGDKYYSYQRLDPLASTIGIAADLVDLQGHMKEKQREKTALLLGVATIQNLSSKTWLSGLTDLVEAINEPDRSLNSFIGRLSGSVAVPAVAAQVARTVDPVLREARTPLDRIRSRIPFASRSLYPKRDVLGREIAGEGGLGPDIVTPIWQSTRNHNPTLNALVDAGLSISAPSRTFADPERPGKRLGLTTQQYDSYQALAGQIAEPLLEELVTGPDWPTMRADDREKGVSDIMRDARKAARESLQLGEKPHPQPLPKSPGLAGLPDPWMAFKNVQ
ncbi:MAG: hypothetical protein ABW184_09900 [Sphingobium sp.]